MPLYLWQRDKGGPWYIRGRAFRGGPVINRSTGLADKKLAAKLLHAEAAEQVKRGSTPAAQWITFQEAMTSFLHAHPPAKASEARRLSRLLDVFDGRLVSSISQVDADAACARLLRPGAAGATRQREVITPLTSILRHAARRQWCAPPQLERPKPAPGRTRWLTPAEAEAIEAAAAEHLRPLIRFLACTGARLSEALELDWRDVDLAGGLAVFRVTKTGRQRVVQPPPACVAALANLDHRTGQVFLRPTVRRGGAIDWAPYQNNGREAGGQIATGFGAAVRRAGIAACSPHDLRHSWATWHYHVHRDPMLLMVAGGWSSLAMVQRYAHLALGDHRAAIMTYRGEAEGGQERMRA